MRILNLDVSGYQDPSGDVVCTLVCNGQSATVTFTGSEVITDVPELARGG